MWKTIPLGAGMQIVVNQQVEMLIPKDTGADWVAESQFLVVVWFTFSELSGQSFLLAWFTVPICNFSSSCVCSFIWLPSWIPPQRPSSLAYSQITPLTSGRAFHMCGQRPLTEEWKYMENKPSGLLSLDCPASLIWECGLMMVSSGFTWGWGAMHLPPPRYGLVRDKTLRMWRPTILHFY